MKRNLKIIGLLVAAVLLIGAETASPASATQFQSKATHTHVRGAALNIQTWLFGPVHITCEQLSQWTSTFTHPPLTGWRISVAYKTCHVVIIFTFAATVNMNGCEYELKSSGDLEIVCAAGKEIEVSSAGCTVKVPAQKITGGIEYSNNAEKSKITATLIGKKVKYSMSGSSCATKTGEDGEMRGSVLMEGENSESGAPTSIWVE